MRQYLDLLKEIKQKGTKKPPARKGMPGSLSLFGYQYRHDLSKGFPLITTKKMFWKGVVTELLFFLRGDTNIKYLVDNGVHIWDEDAYNYYLKQMDKVNSESFRIPFGDFIKLIEKGDLRWKKDMRDTEYKLGDCGYQYGKLWRDWESTAWKESERQIPDSVHNKTDQIKNVIQSLKSNPLGRRHIVTAWDPAHLDDMALNACHVLFQFNCRPLTKEQQEDWMRSNLRLGRRTAHGGDGEWGDEKHDGVVFGEGVVPEYYLDCHLYQRSADFFLGAPFNIASYALLTHIIAKMCNMVVGDFIHSFGDVHVYDTHIQAVEEQLSREPRKLPTLVLSDNDYWKDAEVELFEKLNFFDFILEGYDPYPRIEAELSTGLIK